MDSTATADALTGSLLDGRYRVGRRVARGGMATVYKGIDERLDRPVALKVVLESLAGDTEFTQRFVREARAAARLSHPGIVAVYDQGESDGLWFMVMEYVEGRRTLRDLIRAEAPLPPARALGLLDDLVQAIVEAHRAGIVHRDLKPENILLDPRDRVKVTDFGLARAITSATTATATGGVLMGTVSYLPPELLTDGSADARSDIYSLGVLAFELLTGQKPHSGDSPIQVAYKHVHDDVPAPSTLQPDIPPYVDAFIARATARQRDLRPADAHVMLRQLRRVRDALNHGVDDDRELTADLTPTIAVTAPPHGGSAGSVDEVFDQEAYADPPPADEHTLVVGQPPTPAPTPRPAPATPTPRPAAPAAAAQPSSPVTQRQAPAQPWPRRRQRRLRGLVIFVVVVLLAACAAVGAWYYGESQFQATPDIVSLSQRAAAAKLDASGLSLTITGSVYSETVQAGHLVSTNPQPGSRIHDGDTVHAVISKGPERHQVPTVQGMPLSAARAKMVDHALSVDITRSWNPDVPQGTVIEADPEPGTSLKPDTEVSLVVSKGPEPIEIADVTGRPAEDAEEALSNLGFDVETTTQYSQEVEEGAVIRQSPRSGVGHRGDQVWLVISKGPRMVQVPDVSHYAIEDAKDALTAAGFDVEVEHNTPYFGLGFVVDQEPSADDMAPLGSTITLSVV